MLQSLAGYTDYTPLHPPHPAQVSSISLLGDVSKVTWVLLSPPSLSNKLATWLEQMWMRSCAVLHAITIPYALSARFCSGCSSPRLPACLQPVSGRRQPHLRSSAGLRSS
ncbi:hypothetical protein CgunFtcFv8_002566 [Champsocephalus gunnari]|uniref:Uncharacterized protein n=1 Tax=Champsocephalus gunnari TaxID=52237 RepID=A0AAN8DBI2_CHAGU|nr:hypothetical protein CgunFtcFv8_002566 [Champsocephalus gunnari]